MDSGSVVMRGKAVLIYYPKAQILKCEGCGASIPTMKQWKGRIEQFTVDHARCEVK